MQRGQREPKMERNTMNNRINSLKWWVLGCVMLVAGAQSALASLSGCDGTVYFKLPDGWKSAYAVAGGQKAAFTKSSYANWLQVSTANIGGPNAAKGFVIEETGANDCNSGHCVRKDSMDVKYLQISDNSVTAFTCSDFSSTTDGELWISAHPDPTKKNTTYVSKTPPDVKYFYVFLPNTEEWKSAVPMIKEGDKESMKMTIDSDHCGWYFRRYIDEPIPTSVIIHKDDDETLTKAIGMEGTWAEEGTAAKPIDLNGLYDLFGSDTLYFVADAEEAAKLVEQEKGWYTVRPAAEGKCSYDLAALIYDTDASLHGAFTCNPDWSPGQTPEQAHANACFYPSVKYPVVSSAAGEVPCIGVTQGMVESTLDSKGRMVLTAKGKKCFGAQADEAFAAMFTSTPGVNEEYCVNMTFNQVSDGAFEFDSDNYLSPGATVKGGFYPAEEAPAATMMLSDRLVAAENKRKAEGPIFFCPDYNNQKSTTPEGLRTVHPTEGVPMSDLICNGPGWNGGINCEQKFAAGSEFNDASVAAEIQKKLGVTWEGDGWGWACEQMGPLGWTYYKENTETPVGTLIDKNMIVDDKGVQVQGAKARWVSGASDSQVLTTGGRNQHFCFESHATFRYKKDLKFSFRGDDDIWVFIGGHLAVDLGGTHLAAPGYVDLNKFMGDTAEVGKEYPLAIFFCDRRTTMSNVRIKTNMYIEQKNGIVPTPNNKGDAYDDYVDNNNRHYSICYKESGKKNCAAAVGSGSGDRRMCGKEIIEAGLTIRYELSTDPTDSDPTAVKVSEEQFAANPIQFNGGINVSDPSDPIVNTDKLKDFLPPGDYYLFIKIGGEYKYVPIHVTGALGVANRTAVAVDENNNYSLPYEYVGNKMASIPKDGVAEVGQLVPLYIAALRDPCTTTEGCDKYLEMQSVPGSKYALHASSKNVIFYEMKNGVLTQIANPEKERTVSDGGIDTVYATILARSFAAGKREEKVSVNVVGSSRMADITFFVPDIVFVDGPTSSKIVTGDPDETIHLKGANDTLYMLALDPNDNECGAACNFALAQLDASAGVIVADAEIVDGRGIVIVRSNKEYMRKADGSGTAFIDVSIAGAPNIHAIYNNLQFQDPPVPTPQLADIFDVHGTLPETELNVPEPYFYKTKEYLDGIGDSLVIYYHRQFHQDSLPSKIEVFWESDKDSVVFEGDEIKAGANCDASTKYCDPVIKLSGKNLSKEVKTGGKGHLKSWATFKPTPTSEPITTAFDGDISDRIAPIIVSARAKADEKTNTIQLQLQFSEPVQKTTAGAQEQDNVFSFYINNGKEHQFKEFIPVKSGIKYGDAYTESQTLVYSQSDAIFPQAGDYIHFRSVGGVGLIGDQSTYAEDLGADTLRPADDATHMWNVAPGYDATDRLPSPWVLISGEVSTYIVRLIPRAKGGIPTSQAPAAIEKLPPFLVVGYDANKVDKDFRRDVLAGTQLAGYGFIPHGWFVKNDMGALVDSKEEYAGIDKSTVFFDYDFQLFTNLGAHVAGQKGRISCTDELFNGDCVKNRRNFFVLWNMKSDKNRMVGSGAYIAKIKTYVQLGKFGKTAKLEKSEMWGVRHNSNEMGSLSED